MRKCPEQPEGEGEEEERGDGEHVLQNSEENILCVGIFMCFSKIVDTEKEISKTLRKISLNADLTFWDICVVCKS